MFSQTRHLAIALVGALAMAPVAQAQDGANAQDAAPVANGQQAPQNPGSYYIGLSIGEQMRSQGMTTEDIDVESLAMAIADELSGRGSRLNEQQLNEAGQAVQQMLQAKAQQRMQEMQNAAAANVEKAKQFLAENAQKEGVETLPSGLQYKVEKSGTGASPTLESVVRVHYTGKLMNGEVFDSSVQRGQPAEFQVGQLIPGWQQALPKMKVGDKWTLYVPPALAYGERGSPPKIGPNELLIFEMELLDILQQ
ncbi:FKBP-type peptidyl-prolyl cis-trans isomerase [Candidatus Laterigemmans baculatus]|nr:FKBP-type peptidyl-prolyl cis-trans isomerase [Candidatus Laterigemmans baculatus]